MKEKDDENSTIDIFEMTSTNKKTLLTDVKRVFP